VMSFWHFSGLNPRPFIGRQRLAAERYLVSSKVLTCMNPGLLRYELEPNESIYTPIVPKLRAATGFNSDAFGKSIKRDCLSRLEVKANYHEKTCMPLRSL